ncbi:hypothetical protein J19TS2_29360 [Cohnella xylanilytica]|uniref:Uncharacterized protein n=1 Tax=Cohnella xylanilytica TaxID=557555 RepID=A0A841UB66_9BACL|nr:hypothetical protein [Cohnella xylanilytica]MBB6695473.1 hypothetical protein [Cohnella xylanilytica]GIO13381.1 hypothetical protein J19TS2_29360 [Cohnella xylanilytica]
MEQLFEFLVRHYYIVIVVVWMLYAMFFRKSPIEKRPPNRMPNFGGGGLSRPKPSPSANRPEKRADAPGEASPFPEPSEPRSRPESPRRRLERSEPWPSERPEAGSEPSGFPADGSGRPSRLDSERSEPVRPQPESPARPVSSSPPPAPGRSGAAERSASGAGYAAAEAADRMAAVAAASPASAGEQPLAAAAPEAPGLRLPRDELSRAIVWAEILGPPRSRKPYRR